jgi:hypothetical protein
MLLIFALVGVFVFHLFRTDRVDSDKKALWAVVLFLGNMMALPIYWYLYLWRQQREDTAAALLPAAVQTNAPARQPDGAAPSTSQV